MAAHAQVWVLYFILLIYMFVGSFLRWFRAPNAWDSLPENDKVSVRVFFVGSELCNFIIDVVVLPCILVMLVQLVTQAHHRLSRVNRIVSVVICFILMVPSAVFQVGYTIGSAPRHWNHW